jgi:hypothetical protein
MSTLLKYVATGAPKGYVVRSVFLFLNKTVWLTRHVTKGILRWRNAYEEVEGEPEGDRAPR